MLFSNHYRTATGKDRDRNKRKRKFKKNLFDEIWKKVASYEESYVFI